VLLFDEPLSNLDAKLRVQMRHEIRELQRTLGITTVYVTHDQEEAMAVSDRIAVMSGGSVVQEGTAEDLYHRPASQFVAQFVGRVNLVPGRVTSIAGDVAKVATLGATVDALVVTSGLSSGANVRLVVRPESISIAPLAPGSAALTATVASRAFLGEKIEYLVRCADETLQVVRYDAGPGDVMAEGSTVAVRFAEGAVTVLPEAVASPKSE
jgi:ABC-type Fe3+/spermidine/putrescine transport system ATPase subunit